MPESETFAFADLQGEVVRRFRPDDLEAEVRRLIDPAAAEETIHWARNYLYRTHLETPEGRVDVVVKQFRNQGRKARLLRQLRGSKATRSFRIARAFEAAGLPTPQAVMLIESTQPEGPSFFVARHLSQTLEARYLFRAANKGRERQEFPEVDFEAFVASLGRTLRSMHEAGFFHRDLSIGNVLLKTGEGSEQENDLFIIDLNRTRQRRRLTLSQRTRDLCRLALFRPEHQRLLLTSYWGGDGPGFLAKTAYRLYHHGFLWRIESKKRLRAVTGRLRDWVVPRRAHAHIPEAPAGASRRDKIVWDYLSDQPHQHAGGLEKLTVRLADVPNHARELAAFLAASPRIVRRYRRLRRDLYQQEIPWDGVGIAVRPMPRAQESLLDAIDDLGVDKVLLRLHPWDDDHDAEEELARALVDRGYELAFALPQNRDLVRDPERWRSQITELAERFAPLGRHFQVGQAINRSKWGVWQASEYLKLAEIAVDILKRYPGVEVLGPAVIDFEAHATAAVLNLPGLGFRFDALASLLYVDRRGAPENTQLGFDTVGKVVLLKAIAETARNSGPRSWITEFNWPLWEGPHSPAGRSVSVDEESQASYLARFYLLALATGAVERVYWWQLVARGYGLIVSEGDGASPELRRRRGFYALQNLARQLRGTRFIRPLVSPPGTYLYLFRGDSGRECVVGWSVEGERRATLPRPPETVVERDGESAAVKKNKEVELAPSVRYFYLLDEKSGA